MSSSDDLTSGEGVDEGSADSTAEGPGTGSDGGLLGEPPHGAPVDGEQAAGPVDMESRESRAARDERGTGQQYATGEG